jgi:F0F1-type ATP synthase membrane subunit b/b'
MTLALVVPAVRALAADLAAVKQRVEARQSEVAALKTSGAIGENNRGLLEARGGGGNSAKVIADETSDRAMLYAEAAKRTGVSAEEAGKAYERTLADAKGKAQALGQETAAQLAAETETKRKALDADLNAKIAAAEAQIVDTKARAMGNVDEIARDAAAAIVQHLTGQTPDAGAIASAVAAAKS